MVGAVATRRAGPQHTPEVAEDAVPPRSRGVRSTATASTSASTTGTAKGFKCKPCQFANLAKLQSDETLRLAAGAAWSQWTLT
jgi:hypothetical protein